MADKEISALTAAGTLDGTEIFHTVQAGNSRKVSLDQIAAFGSGAGFKFITALDAANDATLDFTGFDQALYEGYVFVLQNIIPALDNQGLFVRTSANGGVSYDGGASDYVHSYVNAVGGTVTNPSSAGSSAIQLVAGLGSDAGEDGVSGLVYMPGPHLAKKTTINTNLSGFSTTGALIAVNGSGARIAQAGVNAIRFLMSSGNIESGRIAMYGY